jgi:hypothetical protein
MKRASVRELLARVMLLVSMRNQPLVPTERKTTQCFSSTVEHTAHSGSNYGASDP